MWRQHVPYTTFNICTGQVLIKKQASEYNGFIFCLLSFWEAQFIFYYEKESSCLIYTEGTR